MIWVVALAVGALASAGAYLALGRDLLRVVVGVSLLASGINLVVASAGRVDAVRPAFVDPAIGRLAPDAANPVPQALVLTAIVIGFSLMCLSLVLLLAFHGTTAGRRVDDLLAAEPPPPAGDGAPAPDDDV
ncbi:MAG: sodium:proton antiporter [Vicinamibacterales bacterium]